MVISPGQNVTIYSAVTEINLSIIRDWSLITGRGWATKRKGGGHVKFYPYEKGGAENVLAMLKGGHKK